MCIFFTGRAQILFKAPVFFRPKGISPANCNKHCHPIRFDNYFLLLGMTDVHSTEIRSYNMSRIKGKNTKPELLVRRFLFANGFRYRLNVKTLPGKPDIVLPKYNTVIFINGCFWHGCAKCSRNLVPATNPDFWQLKIEKNKTRDRKISRELRQKGWHVIRVWEHDLKKHSQGFLNRIKRTVDSKW